MRTHARNISRAQESGPDSTASLIVLTAPINPIDIMAWLKQIVSDKALTPFTVRVGSCILTYVNKRGGGNIDPSDKGKAWMSVATMAEDMGATERGVLIAIEALIDRDHLVRHSSTGGSKFN